MKVRTWALALALLCGLTVRASAQELTPTPIEDNGGALARFQRALADVRAKKSGAILRIVHYGDSITSNDSVTKRLRERLQDKLGDGGAGFVPFALPSPSFRHHSVLRTHKGWKEKNVTFKNLADKRYSIGGSAFEGSAGAQSTFSTMKKGNVGKSVSKFDIYYLIQPKGGLLELTLDGAPKGTIDTSGPEVKSGFHSVEVPDGEHALTVKVKSGRVRVFGVVMERPGPGVTADNLGLASNSAKSLKNMRKEHLREQHDHRNADLMLIHLGANEADWYTAGAKSIADYAEVFNEVLDLLRAGAPKASCLVMGSTDASVKVENEYVTKPALPGMVEAQRKAAAAKGCAFWDSFKWMGGKGSVKKWRKAGVWNPDLTHPNASGAAKLADGVIDALIK